MFSFPHYMWGYIGHWKNVRNLLNVPSLYVRVYRAFSIAITDQQSSLIICEGISRARRDARTAEEFPHYMWGYIPFSELYHIFNPVPSLYVMVYRLKKLVGTRSERSIIICEGISQEWVKPKMNFLFPHYMWGYISSASLFSFISFVPSLYVRVYHLGAGLTTESRRSLIICEGISNLVFNASNCFVFPHYMWGYIVLAFRQLYIP